MNLWVTSNYMFDERKAGSCENTSNRISLPKTIRPCTPHGPQQINNGWLRQPTALRNSSLKYLYSLSASGFLFPNSSSQRIFKTCDRYGSKFSSLKWTWNKHGKCHDTAEQKIDKEASITEPCGTTHRHNKFHFPSHKPLNITQNSQANRITNGRYKFTIGSLNKYFTCQNIKSRVPVRSFLIAD